MNHKIIKKWTTLPTLCLVFCVFNAIAADDNSDDQTQENPINLEQLLLMPGKLTDSHAHLERNCSNCHVHFDKSNQAPLCLDCHKQTKEDIDNKTGFHGRLAKEQLNQCSSCHSDHLGRDKNIMTFDMDTFNHEMTDFPIKGEHAEKTCQSCHDKTHPKSNKPTFLLPEATCSSCHNDPHEGRMEQSCNDCHSQDSWQISDFNHDETDFPLKGKHQDVTCQSCHVQEVSLPLGNECSNCHRSVDNHLGVFGDKCDSCHTEQGWKKTDYDHLKETEFALEGKHNTLACADCHFEQQNPTTTCHGCHQQNDIHLGSNGDECQQCHNNDKWQKAEFDHDKNTPFALVGAHKGLACEACHLPGQTQQPDDTVRQCKDCHLANDPHEGHLGKQCQSCHQQQKWHKNVTFNHEFTDFPLTGGHGLLVCQSCHESKDFQVEQQQCVDCHKMDDYHDNTLGENCANCHNTSSWTTWLFDHQNQTNYPLEGAHQNLSCELCHAKELKEPLKPAQTCIACHKADDVHQGRLGTQCQQCHNKERFVDVQN